MNDERLSALIDDELPGDETRAALDEVLAEPRARAAWGRYHLIGDALRASAAAPADIAARPYPDNVVAFPAHNAPAPSSPPRAPRVGLALAAAAALAAVALIIAAPRPDAGPAVNPVAQNSAPGPITAPSAEPLPNATISQADMVREDEAERRLNVYLYDFNDKRARQSAPGTHSYVHIVGFERP